MIRFKNRWGIVAALPLAVSVGMVNLNSWRPRRVRVVGQPFQVAFSPDGKYVALASQSNTSAPGQVEVWDVSAPSPVRQPSVDTHRSFAVEQPRSICFSGDSQILVCTAENQVSRYDLKAGKQLKPLVGEGGLHAQTWKQPDTVISSVYGGWKQRNIRTGKGPTQTEFKDEEWGGAEAFAPDGRTVAYISGLVTDTNVGIIVRDTKTRRQQRFLLGKGTSSDSTQYNVDTLTFSPDSRLLAVGWNGTIYNANGDETVSSRVTMWDVQARKMSVKWNENDKRTNAHAFSPDGLLLAAAREESAVSLRDTRSGKLERLLKTAGASVKSVTFSPDGRTLASCGSDGALYLWRVQ